MYVGYANIMYVVDVGGVFLHTLSMEEANSERIITPMSKSLVEAIDNYRFDTRSPSRAEAIRRLIQLGLAAAKASTNEGSA